MSATSKTVIVTGAGGGLGRAIAEAFLAAGARVVLADINETLLSETVAELGEKAHGVTVDVSSEESVAKLFAEAEKLGGGRIDVLVNNAGVMDKFDPVGELDKSLWDKVLAINLTGPYITSKLAVNHMLSRKPKGGVILNVSSMGGMFGARAGAAYTASKHGLVGLTKNTAAFYSKKGIRCNAICPGGMMTNITSAFASGINDPGQQVAFSTMAMQPELSDPNDVAKLAVFLCSDEATVVNGAIVTADQAWSAF